MLLGMVAVSLLHFFVANCFIDNARAFLQWNAVETAGDCVQFVSRLCYCTVASAVANDCVW